jgi:hypothetical protein
MARPFRWWVSLNCNSVIPPERRAPAAKGLTLATGGMHPSANDALGDNDAWDIEKSSPQRVLPRRLTTWRATKHTHYFQALRG